MPPGRLALPTIFLLGDLKRKDSGKKSEAVGSLHNVQWQSHLERYLEGNFHLISVVNMQERIYRSAGVGSCSFISGTCANDEGRCPHFQQLAWSTDSCHQCISSQLEHVILSFCPRDA